MNIKKAYKLIPIKFLKLLILCLIICFVLTGLPDKDIKKAIWLSVFIFIF